MGPSRVWGNSDQFGLVCIASLRRARRVVERSAFTEPSRHIIHFSIILLFFGQSQLNGTCGLGDT